MSRTITKFFFFSVFIFITILFFNSVAAQVNSKIFFESKDLGVRIYKSDLPPYYKKFDTKNWNTYSLTTEGIKFSYPPNTCLESTIFSSKKTSSCDTMITISFKGRVHVDFILSSEPFEYFADNFGFEKYLPDTSKVDSVWDFGVLGRAEEFLGDKWRGLSGFGTARLYGEEGYIGATDEHAIFFFMFRPEKCNIIFSYYSGPNTDLCEDSGFPESSFDEYAFFEMVSSLTFTGD